MKPQNTKQKMRNISNQVQNKKEKLTLEITKKEQDHDWKWGEESQASYS